MKISGKVVAFTLAGTMALSGITWLTSIRHVPAGHVGIKTTMGVPVETVTKPGPMLVAPFWFGGLEKIDTRLQVKDYDDLSAAAKGGQDAFFNLEVKFNVNGDKAEDLFIGVGKDYIDKLLSLGTLDHALKSITPKYTPEQMLAVPVDVKELEEGADVAAIVAEREADAAAIRDNIADEIKKRLNDEVEQYGLTVSEIKIKNIRFSDKYTQAIEDKQLLDQQLASEEKRTDLITKQNANLLLEAQGKSAANDELARSVTEQIIEWEKIKAYYEALRIQEKAVDKWNSQLPYSVGGGGTVFDIGGFGSDGEQKTK